MLLKQLASLCNDTNYPPTHNVIAEANCVSCTAPVVPPPSNLSCVWLLVSVWGAILQHFAALPIVWNVLSSLLYWLTVQSYLTVCVHVHRYAGHVNSDYKLDSCLSQNDSHVISGSEDGRVCFWDLVEVRCRLNIEILSGIIMYNYLFGLSNTHL